MNTRTSLALLIPIPATALGLVLQAAWAQEAAAPAPATQTQSAGVGLLSGQILVEGSQVPIEGVLVTATGPGGKLYSRTDETGKFVMELPEGAFEIELTHPRFAAQTISGIGVRSGVEQQIALTMGDTAAATAADASQIGAVTVEGAYVKGAVDAERYSSNVLDVLSAEDFAATGDAGAVDALARVTGLTVVSDKYVYVRGLGERYSTTTLNGATLPSPDPVRRVVPLDLFPTATLDSVEVQKTWSPDKPADFSGGLLELKSRELERESTAKVSARVEANSQTTSEDGLFFEGGNRDWTGFDDGFRDLPATIDRLTQGGTVPISSLTPEQQREAALALNNEYDTKIDEIPAGIGIELAVGSPIGDSNLSYSLGARYTNDWAYRVEERANFSLDGSGGLAQRDDGEQFRTENEIDLSGVLNLAWELSAAHSLKATTFITRSTEERLVREFALLAENDINVADSSVEWEERQLLSQQLSGEHLLGGFKIGWQGTYARADREQPDRRFWRYELIPGGSSYLFSDTGISNERSWEDLEEEANTAGLDLSREVSFSDTVLTTFQAGVAWLDRDRESSFRRFRYQTDFSQNNLRDTLDGLSPEEIFIPANIGPGLWELNETTLATDNYSATETVTAGYLMADAQLGENWRLMLGGRYENAEIEVTTFNLISPADAVRANLDEDDILPALTVTWALAGDMQLRFGASRTLNRPDLKELSPAPYTDPDERYPVFGNPLLQIAEITNYDLRWEWYWTSIDSLQLAVFYKDFENPIERVIRLGGPAGVGVREYANADSAENQGVELQLRSGLGYFGSAFDNFSVKFNAAYIDSTVDVGSAGAQQTNPERPLYGQSDWVTNLQLFYQNADHDIDAALLFSMAGEYVVDVGAQGLPDIYEQPAGQLDFNYSQNFGVGGQDVRLKFKALNLLDPEFERKQGDAVTRSYTLGRTYYFGLEFDF